MATKVYLIPESGFVQVDDPSGKEYLIPEGCFFNEPLGSTGSTGSTATISGGLFFCHG